MTARTISLVLVILFSLLSHIASAEVTETSCAVYRSSSIRIPETAREILQLPDAGAARICSTHQGILTFAFISEIRRGPLGTCQYIIEPAFNRLTSDGKSAWSLDAPPELAWRRYKFTYMADKQVEGMACPSYGDGRYVETSGISETAFIQLIEAWEYLKTSASDEDLKNMVNTIPTEDNRSRAYLTLKSWFESKVHNNNIKIQAASLTNWTPATSNLTYRLTLGIVDKNPDAILIVEIIDNKILIFDFSSGFIQ